MAANRRYQVTDLNAQVDFSYRLGKAIREKCPVTIEYTRLDGKSSLRTIDPYDADASRDFNMIIRALDRQSGEIRAFRFDRISAYTVHKGKTRLTEE